MDATVTIKYGREFATFTGNESVRRDYISDRGAHIVRVRNLKAISYLDSPSDAAGLYISANNGDMLILDVDDPLEICVGSVASPIPDITIG